MLTIMKWMLNRNLTQFRCLSISAEKSKDALKTININNVEYVCDDYTNVTPKIISHVGTNLHNSKYNPLCLIKKRIIKHFYTNYTGKKGNPIFSIYDHLHPVVTVYKNFDSLLIPNDHVSRNKSDTYYLNREYLLRCHTTAHQTELINMGLDSFLVFGDVYRRDEIDPTHYPVFHQLDAVRLYDKYQIRDVYKSEVEIFDEKCAVDTEQKQAVHTCTATEIMENELKSSLLTLVQALFTKDIEHRWVPSYFPFTHPSWELEIKYNEKWLELLGCGVIKHGILSSAGAGNKIGWAFGIGLERLAMLLYTIPDIRLFWSNDTGFLSQFRVEDVDTPITYKPVSIYPQCKNDISFWLKDNNYHSNDFYELAYNIGGDIVEQINLIDEFHHPKSGRISHCYRIIYRHMEKTLTQEDVNIVHTNIEKAATEVLGVTIR